jgi:hypothetical protein
MARSKLRSTVLLSLCLGASALGASCTSKDASTAAAASSAPAAVAPASTSIDDLLAREHAARGLTLAAPADDATFLRRATVDVVGRIPTEDEARAFLADARPDKRAVLIDRLLASPEHADRLARWWEDVMLGPEAKKSQLDRGAFRRWLAARFADGSGWDAIVRDLVTASGASSAGGKPAERMLAADAERAAEEKSADVNGAVNWLLRYRKSPQDVAGAASRAFLGVDIQCAQCHDHKTESWKQADFESFAASFARVDVKVVEKGRTFEVREGDRPSRKLRRTEAAAGMAKAAPRALDGTELGGDGSPRQHLAAWMTSRDNPWTSRAFVNRLWARYLGMGFVDPVDDFRPSQPPVVPEVLDAVAERFEAGGWSIRAVEREILLSRAYAAGAAPIQGDVQDARWSTFALRPMDEDALVDSFFVAADAERRFARMDADRAAKRRALLRRSIALSFDQDAESNATRFDGTIQQALMLMNAEAVGAATDARTGMLADVVERGATDPDGALDALWLRTLTRLPTAAERDKVRALLAQARGDAKDEAKGEESRRRKGVSPEARVYEDVFWSLLNASEFAFVH